MTVNEKIRGEYFSWLVAVLEEQRPGEYSKLLSMLFDTEFVWKLTMDENRAKDGIDLRERFIIFTRKRNSELVLQALDGPCSVLEMMIALSVRIEEHIMSNSVEGDRTGNWFWIMLHNLGLDRFDDSNFDFDRVEFILETFHSRAYNPDGRGGLFCIENPPKDLRRVEIWYQANWFFNEILGI